MTKSKATLANKAAALKLKLKKTAEAHAKHAQEALEHAREAEELEAAANAVAEPVAELPCADDSCCAAPEPVASVLAPSKQSWWQRFFGSL